MKQTYQTFRKDKLQVRIYEEETEMGYAAAEVAASYLLTVIKSKGEANLILATGTSQFSFLNALKEMNLDWKNINVFHLDEYKGLSDQHPASFRRYLKDRILDQVRPAKVFLIEGDAENLDEKMDAYQSLLKHYPVDLACIGIGENGHIAFNDPPVADFNDLRLVKLVELDEACRMQQFKEGWFPSVDKVPREAVTLTIPAIMNAKKIICIVPGKRKAKAVSNTINGDIHTKCPSTILRNHPDAVLLLDRYAASEIYTNVVGTNV